MNTIDASTLPPQREENVWEWEWLLAERPEAAEHFTRWDLFGGFAWVRLLSLRPEFADKCSWWKLKPMAWRQLLLCQPQFAAKYGAGDMSAHDIIAKIEARLTVRVNNSRIVGAVCPAARPGGSGSNRCRPSGEVAQLSSTAGTTGAGATITQNATRRTAGGTARVRPL